MNLSRSAKIVAVGIAAVALVAGAGYAGASTAAPPPTQAVPNLPPPSAAPNPFIASGVAIGKNVAIYKSSGIGPSAAATSTAPVGTPQRFIDAMQFPGGALSPGVTITEAQGMNALARIQDNLASAGLDVDDVITMRVFLDNPPGEAVADYAGWNRAYRQFFANTNRVTRDFVPVQLGTAAPMRPLVVNPARPSRFTIEVASLPVAGWLVEVEVDAVFPR